MKGIISFLESRSEKVRTLVIACVVSCIGVLACVPVLASTTVDYEDFSSVITAVTSQVSVANIVGVLAAVMAIAIALVFMWWGIRKALRMIMSAFRKGRASA